MSNDFLPESFPPGASPRRFRIRHLNLSFVWCREAVHVSQARDLVRRVPIASHAISTSSLNRLHSSHIKMPPRHIKNISLVTFENTLLRYPSIVPEKLRELDTLRYDTIPAKVAKRGLSAGLEKDEVVRLVEWKL